MRARQINRSTAAITSGAINGTAIGATTPASGAFTTLSTTGNAGIGSVPIAIGASTYALQVHGLTAGTAGVAVARWSSDSNGPLVVFGKSRGGAIGAHGAVSSGDIVGNSSYLASDGAAFRQAASFQAIIDGTPSGDMPGRLAFFTTNAGSLSATEKMRLNNSGALLIATTTSDGVNKLQVAGGASITGGIAGTVAGGNAAAGYVGELITATVASGSAVALTTATGANVTSISLTAGDWDVSAQTDFVLAGATSTLHQSGISAASATLPTQAGGGGIGTDPLATLPLPTTALSGTLSQAIPPVQVNLTSTTTIYLVAKSSFSVGTESAYGTIRARRMR